MMDTKMSERQFTGWHMLLVLGLFFGTIITVNLIMAYYANSTWSGLVVKNSYVASQKFNAQQAEARAHAALGWKASVSYADSQFRFSLLDAAGHPVVSDEVKVKLIRPAHEGSDQLLTLTAEGGGSYSAPVRLGDGQWVAEILVEAGLEAPYRYAERIVVKDGGV